MKAVLGNGKEGFSVSTGVYLDITPPTRKVFFYVDVALNENEPVEYQSSNSTIKIGLSYEDRESQVKVFWHTKFNM